MRGCYVLRSRTRGHLAMKRPKTGGRTAGTPNKITAEIKDVARQHGPAALAQLARIMTSSPRPVHTRRRPG